MGSPRSGNPSASLADARLAAAMGFHSRNAALVAKYYSLGVELESS